MYREKLDAIINSKKFEKFEVLGGLRVAISRCIINKYQVYIRGGGGNTAALIKSLRAEGIETKGIVDKNPALYGKLINNVRIISLEELKTVEESQNIFVFIFTSFFTENTMSIMVNELNEAGIINWYAITSDERARLFDFRLNNHIEYYQKNIDVISDVIDLLYDTVSKDCYLEYIRTWIENSPWRLPMSHTANKYFYGGTLTEKEILYTHLDDEVWLNCGCHVGDTIFCFFQNGLTAKKIYAIDNDSFHISLLKENLLYLSEEARKTILVKNIFLDENSDFEGIFEGKRITLVNADIEGAELAFLKNLTPIIKKDRPVIAICIYHKPEDIVEIPMYLHEIMDNYHYMVRKYPATNYVIGRQHELVLYAIPNERAR